MANFHVKNLAKPTPPLLKRISKSLIALGTALTSFSFGGYVAMDDPKMKNLCYLVGVISLVSFGIGTLILNMFGTDENDTPTT